ncbi:MAG TPA: protein-disulfide reductase DsbD domain-containing protein [Gemmatimonas sp.]|uniref:protein-disulfide reductase DsbD domain-containing protein n=1 Tax=Gemmatimonas sp. TaxID=1962908 RepID=UPI002ED771EA
MSVLASIALLIGSNVSSLPVQPVERVKWAVTRVTRAVRGDTQFVQIGAQIDPGWHVYSLTQQPDGPFPLRVTSGPASAGSNTPWTVAGTVKGPVPERQPTSPFGIPVEWYSGAPQFSVPLIANAAASGTSTAVLRVRYQACSDTLCLPPKTIELSTRLAAR